jgi:hypothetical protein
MKKVVIINGETPLSKVADDCPVFAMKGGRLKGMVVEDDGGWILKVGGIYNWRGYHETREECLLACQDRYDFFVEEEGDK